MQKTNLKQAYNQWLSAQNFTMFGTLKFFDDEDLNIYTADRRLRLFFNILDRKIRKHKAIKEGKRIERFVFIERGKSRQHLHAHFFIKAQNKEEHKRIMNWTPILNTKKLHYGIDIKLQEIDNHTGIIGYCNKEMDNINTDILVTNCTHINNK